MCQGTCVGLGGQLPGFGSLLLPIGSQGSNPGCHLGGKRLCLLGPLTGPYMALGMGTQVLVHFSI